MKKLDKTTLHSATIETLSHEGRGIAHVNGRIVFIDGGLPGEAVKFTYTKLHRRYDEAKIVTIQNPSAKRIAPQCEHFMMCGGCSLQHLSEAAQLELKQDALLQQLKHFGEVEPAEIMPPITASAYHYRRKARLGVRYLNKFNEVIVGFREKNGRFLARINQCEILSPPIGKLITPLKSLIAAFSDPASIAQIEVAVADNASALVFRNLQTLTDTDLQHLKHFAETHQLQIYLQPGGPDTIAPFYPTQPEKLRYKLTQFDITIYFDPTHFTQVNNEINQQMITRAIELLDLDAEDNVLDLFCGLGNFSLPIAKFAKSVVGVEGDEQMVQSAKYNAVQNNIHNVDFFAVNLQQNNLTAQWLHQPYAKLLLDPPRSGAQEMVEILGKFALSRLVYVSCNPATLSRDAKILCGQGFKLNRVGIIDMFPQTTHVETIALFTR